VSPTEREPNGLRMKLLPHQTDLVDTALSTASKRVIQLQGEVGLGKSTALVALAKRLVQERPAARVLMLVPGALRRQFAEMLGDADTPTLFVDRRRFREMLDSTTRGEFWPRGVVAVLSQDFAKQPDILESLAATHWDLVIADEAHGFRGARADALQRIGVSAERVVLATATLPDLGLIDAFPAGDTMVVEWRRDRVFDHDGRLLDVVPPPILHEVPFRLTSAELSLRETVRHLCNILEGSGGPQNLITKIVLRSLQSSPTAAEGVLRRLSERLMANGALEQSTEFAEEEPLEDPPRFQVSPSVTAEASEVIARALEQFEEITVDSKLNELGKLLSRLTKTKTGSPRICVLTAYVATLFYLAADIEDRNMNCLRLHGSMSVEDRHRSLMSFGNAEGILLATPAAMTEGDTMGEVTDLVLYDIPGTRAALVDVLARFDWFDRRSQLSIHILAPADSVDRPDSEPIQLLREILDSDVSRRLAV
jgi:SNF2 family DNA or RNA helicase